MSLLSNAPSTQHVKTRLLEPAEVAPLGSSSSRVSVGKLFTVRNDLYPIDRKVARFMPCPPYQKDEGVLLVFALPGVGHVLIRATVHWASWPFLGVGFYAGQTSIL